MIRAWRLLKSRFSATAFDGEGARLYGGRWNSQGTRVAYASESIALTVLETLVHLQNPGVLSSYSLVSLQFPEELVEILKISELPPDWRASPGPPEIQRIGDQWITSSRSVVLSVPSVIVPSARNYLLNPMHRDFDRVAIDPAEAFVFDKRLLGE